MPPAVGVGTPPKNTPTTPSVTSVPVLPPQVLPSHSAPAAHAARPLSAPHQDIAGLHKTLADKVGSQTSNVSPDSISSNTTGGAGMPPSPIQPTIDTQVTPPPPKKGGMGKVLIALALFLVTVLGAGAAYYLNTQNQDTRQKAAYYDNSEIKSGLSVTITSQPNSSADSYYRPASSDLSDSSKYYDQSKGERVEFTVPVRNLKDAPISDKHQLLAFKIDTATVNGQEVPITENSPYSEQQIYDIHKGSDDRFNGTKQTLKYSSGWQDFTVQPDEQKMISGSWTPTAADCGMYQLDMQIESATGDQIVGVGMIRVKNCQQAQTKVSGGVTCYAGGKRYAVQGVSVSVDEKNFTTGSNGFYTSDGIAANKMVAARLTLPDTFNIQELDGNNNPTGAVMQASKSNLTKLNPNNPSHVINAYNGCAESATPNFMQENCGGVTAERQAQCTNAPMKDGFKAPGSYEYCSLQGGKDVRGGFDFAIYNCVTPPPTTTPPAACNEACSPLTNNCTQNATNTMSCISTPTGEHRCRDTRFPSQANCQAPVTPPPTGAMCMNLCGVASTTSSLTDFASCPTNGGKVGTPAINGYINFKCDYRGVISKAVISVSKDGGAYQEIPTSFQSNGFYSASYKILEQGTYAARCDITAQTPGTYTPPTDGMPPAGTQAACPTTTEYSCVANLEACAIIGDVEMITMPNGQLGGKYYCSDRAQTCCKKDPAKAPNPAKPLCTTIQPGAGESTPRCTFSNLCSGGRIETNASCQSVPGTVCCIPRL